MEINVKGSGATKSFKLTGIEASMTVLEFKQKCEVECKLKPEEQRLFLKGKCLKDEDTLASSKIESSCTLFLVKGASGAGKSSSSSAPAQQDADKKEDTTLESVPCAGGCGFFGTARTENYCSKCYSKKQKADAEKEQKPKEEAKAEEAKEAAASSEGQEATEETQEEKRAEQTDKTKCWYCNKKVGLLGFECRCGYTFCSKHRYAEDHDCDFDHKGKGREILAKNNPNISVTERGLLDGS